MSWKKKGKGKSGKKRKNEKVSHIESRKKAYISFPTFLLQRTVREEDRENGGENISQI